jgi:hypothetical protein
MPMLAGKNGWLDGGYSLFLTPAGETKLRLLRMK